MFVLESTNRLSTNVASSPYRLSAHWISLSNAVASMQCKKREGVVTIIIRHLGIVALIQAAVVGYKLPVVAPPCGGLFRLH